MGCVVGCGLVVVLCVVGCVVLCCGSWVGGCDVGWVGGWLWVVDWFWLCWLIESLPAMIRTTYIRHYRIITGIVFFVSYDLRFTIDVSNIIFVFIVPRSVRPL